MHPCYANEQIINFTTTLHYYDTIFYECWSSKLVNVTAPVQMS